MLPLSLHGATGDDQVMRELAIPERFNPIGPLFADNPYAASVARAYTSHWVSQVSFEEPIVMSSVSPKHDTYPLMVASGQFSVSILAGDQVDVGQYFSYPGRKFRYIADEYLDELPGSRLPVVRNCIAWLRCETFEVKRMIDHDLFFARVTATQTGRLDEPPLLYSSRLGWRIAGDRARQPGQAVGIATSITSVSA